MTRLLLILALVAACFWVYSVVDCAVQPNTRHRGLSKPAWVVLVLVVPVLGGALWFIVGRAGRRTIAARNAPDDDPEFLRSLRDAPDTDARIRQLEEDLARLDAEEATDEQADGDEDDRGARGAHG